ncbi:O-antigen ligase family protein [uncultured Holdemanella sp.]|uniref:O-antigen ligase family protein n=1 Tax=uncultured Holdemanella sp. TaxID=1763549 RepID=UPI0025E320CF|nr:O-antigen ligase family protein [uncultured Holdemanella sp.]
MISTKIKNIEYKMNAISLILIVTGNFCFYTPDTINIYMMMTILGCLIALILNIKYFSFTIYKSNYILWITLVYAIFFFYGFCYLQGGRFSWESFLIRYIENISLYLAIKGLFRSNGENIVNPFSITGVIAIIYLIFKEGSEIITGGIRIGDSLSGNVNTVGFNFGFISLLVTWEYCKKRKKTSLILLMILILFMLLTGSKKALLIVMMDIILIFIYEKGHTSRWLKLFLIFIVGIYVIFNVPYFYNILGLRVESMIDTMLGGNTSISSNTYSYSTDMREEMIVEAFNLFLKKPLFGGGFNNFLANTVTQYEYSHCNYTEMLCSFGLFGTIIFYSKYVSNITYIIKNKLYKVRKYRDVAFIVIFLMIEMLIADWATVTFSGQCLGYLPIIFSNVALEYVRKKERMG